MTDALPRTSPWDAPAAAGLLLITAVVLVLAFGWPAQSVAPRAAPTTPSPVAPAAPDQAVEPIGAEPAIPAQDQTAAPAPAEPAAGEHAGPAALDPLRSAAEQPPESLESVLAVLDEAAGAGVAATPQAYIRATRQALGELEPWQAERDRLYADLRSAGALSVTPGTRPEDLLERRAILRDLAAASDALAEATASLPARIDALLADTIAPAERGAFVSAFGRAARLDERLAERGRERAFCTDGDELLSLLIERPWRVRDGAGVTFDDPDAQRRYVYLLALLRSHAGP